MKYILPLLFFLFATQALRAQQLPEMLSSELAERGEVYFSFQLTQNIELQTIAKLVSIQNIDKDHRIWAFANQQGLERFARLLIPYKLENAPSLVSGIDMAPSLSAFMQSWNYYPTYDQYDSLMHKLANDYPALCRLHDLGTTAGGHKILILQMGDNVAQHENEVRFLYTSSMHGNELTGYILILRLANYLLSNYGQNARVDSLMNNIELWINPLANPDGAYYYNDTSVYGATRYNYNAVDLNRNFPDPKGGNHPDGKSWQTETTIFMDLADSLHFSMAANFHGGAEVMNYPWDTWSRPTSDVDWWLYVCHQYADTAQYYGLPNYFKGPSSAAGTGVTNGYQWYSIEGGRQDYMNYFQHCREVTVELSNAFMPAASTLSQYWDANYRSLLNYMDQARYGLAGIITDSLTNKPLQAKVFISAHDKDESHVFSLSSSGYYHRLLDSGYYDVTFSAPHYFPKTIHNVRIGRDSLTNLNVQLRSDPAAIDRPDNFSVEIFPNPVKNTLYLMSDELLKRIKIYSPDGRLILQKDLSPARSFSLSLNRLNNGFYLIYAQDIAGHWFKQKIIINK